MGALDALLVAAGWAGDDALQQALEQIIAHVGTVGSVYMVPTGSILIWSAPTAPDGWLLCNGQVVSRATYATLFTVIGTVFGAGDGLFTFKLPDLRGRFPLGRDDMGGTPAHRVTAAAADSIGGVDGAENHTLAVGEMPAHNGHFLSTSGGGGYGNAGTGRIFSLGSNQAHNNMPPYLTLTYIIKT